jgi:foldase protein PrsA
MTKAVRLFLALCALALTAAIVAGCGGVPGNAVAEVDGNAIEKTAYDHWLQVAAKSSGQGQAVAVPQPPDYTACIAAKRKTTPKPAKGQPAVTDAQLKTQCKTEYEQLRNQVLQLLISFQWLQKEAAAQGITVTDADVKKSFDQQRKQSFPKDADYQKFLKTSGQTEADILLQVKADLLATKIRDKVVKGKDQVSDAQIADFYNKNKARFAQPQKRDLRVVLTKGKAKAQAALKLLKHGKSWKVVSKKYSIDQASKAQGGKLPAQAKGTLEAALDKVVFAAKKGKILGPIKTQFGFYVVQVTKITPATQQTLAQASATIKQTLQSQNQQKALAAFSKSYSDKWKAKTDCRQGYVIQQCKQGPKATPTPTAAGGATQQVPQQAPQPTPAGQ